MSEAIIRNVVRLDALTVLVTLTTGAEIVCKDDGSFIEWLGESER